MTEPATLDPLSAIAPLFRARPEIQDVCRFALQWEVMHEAEPAGFAQFHIVTNGNCLLERYSGEDANAVEDVILTHLHYDHVGNFNRFPKARYISRSPN